MQEQPAIKSEISKIFKEDILGGIQWFFNLGVDIGTGDSAARITVGTIFWILVSFVVVARLLKLIRRLVSRKLIQEDQNKFKSIFIFLKYLVYLLVVVAVLSATGVNVTVFLTASAALFVGLGFALQTLFQDVISGVFIILDKTIHIGDIIGFDDGKVGRVFEIKLRTTRALTRDDKVIIIPNHKFLTEKVFNWTQNHRTTREDIKILVAYGSDTRLVENVLLSSLEGKSGVLKTPKPFVLFEDFGDFGLAFGLYFFTSNSFIDPKIKSDIRFEIDTRFRESGISIPYPRQDIYLHKNE